MVSNATSYTGSGLRDWLIQRVSAVVLGAYILFLLVFFMSHSGMEYATWEGLFGQLWMKVFTFVALLSLYAHAWIGVWTVLTDYIKPVAIRVTLEVLVVLSLLTYLIWGIVVVWSI
ncbi:MAG: succinate dehydrogenase, hydrophobic membrane anchor protein [Legionellales bacterium]|nr:succinate dehydrogenase, hydrophobic membrane anchor protein [Legionellales bacterium]